MGISFGSMQSGLPKDIVQQLMTAERIPVDRMKKSKGNINAKKDLVGELVKLVEELRVSVQENGSEKNLKELKVNTNDDLVGVTMDKGATHPGNYQFEVVQLAQKSSAMSSAYESPDDSYLGVGFIQYSLPDGSSKDLYIDSDHSSLNGVANLINKNKNIGLRASVINDAKDGGEAWRLILSLSDTGESSRAEFPYFYFVDGDEEFYLEFERESQNAIVKLDGFEVQLPSNKAKNLIPGVTLDLKKAKPGEEFSLNFSEDAEAVADKIEGMITKINNIFAFIKGQNTMNENTDTKRTLGGDLMLQNLESRMRSAIFQPIMTTSGPKRLRDLGVEFQRDGSIKLDIKKFQNSVSEDYDSASQILIGKFYDDGTKVDGVIDNLKTVIKNALSFPSGLLRSRSKTLQGNIDQIDRRIENKERLLTQKESNLKAKFARLESTISEIKNSGAGLSALGGMASGMG